METHSDTPTYHNLPLNPNPPMVMHIDLNSCFATVEQQANKHLRGKAVLIAAYNSPRGCVVAPSIEAKRFGVKTGNRVVEARLMSPNAVVRTPDPPLIRDVHVKLKKICSDYSPNVFPKSIDELVIDFNGMEYFLKTRTLPDIAREIKARIKKEIGVWMSCSIGISTNRFIAKLAASWKKPDGLVLIDHRNLRAFYARHELTDLPYIKFKNQARLKECGIFTPLEFLDAPLDVLKHQVFESITGYYWYKRIRGWEIDDVEFERKSFGQDYALRQSTDDPKEIAKILMKLCEKMGRRLRRHNKVANGVHVACIYNDNTWWHKGKTFKTTAYATVELYRRAQYLLDLQPHKKKLVKLSVSCFGLDDSAISQVSLFDNESEKLKKVTGAIDKINDKYGEFVITPALMMDMQDKVIDRIAFGAVKELEDLYGTAQNS